ncbi:pilus assembly PilX N-terminal domain-containing protein [Candidatus Poribacteria bacterium]|nr:pilus assembly PilX N-terminal domain-containing protein [Candidatus Poribacteria bacterium]
MLRFTRFNAAKEGIARARDWLARLGGNDSGSAVIFAMVMVFVLTLLGGSIANITLFESRDGYRQLYLTQALYVAEAGIARAWQEFNNGATDLGSLLKGADGVANTADDGLLSFGPSVHFGNGTYNVVVTDNDDGDGNVYQDVDSVIQVASTGKIPTDPNIAKTVRVYLKVFPQPTMNLQSAIASVGPVATLGSLTVDGRNRDLNVNIISNSGTLGISTVAPTFQQSGGSKVGGTVNGVDYMPKKSPLPNPAVIQTNANWSFRTPDQVVQFAEGTLKTIAQSGRKGSQYVTNPSNLTFPLSGVTYVELAPGAAWGDTAGIDFLNSSGILVVHNAATNAIIKNLNTGSFTGVIMADDLVHIHNRILGGIVALTPAPSEGNCIGNGTGDVFYSSQAIAAAAVGIGPTVLQQSWF